jgi:dihydroorotate dehydrogenase/Pyruvate/2-oxoacid:ferredoxin oxidoreductase delta subunit
MSDLSVECGKVRFKNPIVAAAGTPTLTVHNMRKCIEAGAAGLQWKSISFNKESQKWTRPGNLFFDKFGLPGMIASWEMCFPSPETALEQLKEIKPFAEENDVKLLMNLALEDLFDFGNGAAATIEEWCEFAIKAEEAGADIIDFVACPAAVEDITSDVMETFYTKSLPQMVKTLKSSGIHLPVWVKDNLDITESIAGIMETFNRTGVDAIQIGGGAKGLTIDIENGKPFFPGPFPFTRAYTAYVCAQAFSMTEIDIASNGAMFDWRDVVERLMCGARLTMVCTAILYGGYKVITQMKNGLDEFLTRKGYNCVGDIIGIANPYVSGAEQGSYMAAYGGADEFERFLKSVQLPKESVSMIVDSEKCNGCKKCSVCLFEAIQMENRKAILNLDVCERCGACVGLCKQDAIKIESVRNSV